MTLAPLVPGRIWHATRPVAFGPVTVTTRMTVVRLADGGLFVHSPIAPDDALHAALSDIGPVRHVVAPNRSHHLFFADFLAAFPDARGYVAPGLADKRPDLAAYPALPADAPWSSDLDAYAIGGIPALNETAFFHRGSGTLILTDLLFSFGPGNRGLKRLLARLLGVHDRLAMSRTMKLLVKDRAALARSVAPLRALPVQRVLVAHEDSVDRDAAARFDAAFAWLD